jgi:DNA-binding SARP family transcriptional activator
MTTLSGSIEGKIDKKPALQVKLLGEFCLVYKNKAVPNVDGLRVQSLLAKLILHGGVPQPRHHLAFTLWPDSSEQQARTNLRRELHHLRHTLPEAWPTLDRLSLWRIRPKQVVTQPRLATPWRKQ